ncbi:MAG: hypothetical protein E5X07_40070 [Mesorhizobium sp.]|nr:MAG: hypothetical protein E5X07_40070 [Mesorhizobium sp.]
MARPKHHVSKAEAHFSASLYYPEQAACLWKDRQAPKARFISNDRPDHPDYVAIPTAGLIRSLERDQSGYGEGC